MTQIILRFQRGLCMVTTHRLYSKKSSVDQPGMVNNPARGQLNREKQYFPVYGGC